MQKVHQHKPHMGLSPHHILSLLLLLGCPSLFLIGAVGSSIIVNDVSATSDGDTNFTVEVQPNLTMKVSSSDVNLPISPSTGGQFGRVGMTVDVSTNNATSYQLTMRASSNTLFRNTGSGLSQNDTIESLLDDVECPEDSDKVCSRFPTKHWGYKVGSGTSSSSVMTYHPVSNNPDEEVILKEQKNAPLSGTTDIYFGAKIDTTTPTGIYSGVTLTFIATAVPENTLYSFESAFANANVRKYNGFYAMQDMTSDICSAVSLPTSTEAIDIPTIQLIDKRDNKIYWVSKLADGKCWMTQNLDFNIDGSRLDSTTTNLVAYGTGPYTTNNGYTQSNGITYWQPIDSAKTIITSRDLTGPKGEINYGANANKWVLDDTKPYSVDPGKWYQTNNYFTSDACNNVSASVGCNFLDGSRTVATATDGTTKPLSDYFSENAYAGNGEHGSLGNYYNWTAAIAANDTTSINPSSDTTYGNSVCPAQWGLPADGAYTTINNLYNGSFSSTNTRDKGLMAAPFYSVRGGRVGLSGGLTTLYDAGRYSFYWSGTASAGSTNAHYLYFDSTGGNPSSSDRRYYGHSVRCIAL